MKFRTFVSTLAVILLVGSLANAGDSPDEKKDKTRKMAAATLEDLYKLEPASRQLIQQSFGYAVFSNTGTNLLLMSTARGAGVAISSKPRQETFMKMVSAGAGLGVGVKDYRVVFAFQTQQ